VPTLTRWSMRQSKLTSAASSRGQPVAPVLFCHVVAITRHPEPRGLMWFDRGYHTLMRPACYCTPITSVCPADKRSSGATTPDSAAGEVSFQRGKCFVTSWPLPVTRNPGV
jgi:hypothetical protein